MRKTVIIPITMPRIMARPHHRARFEKENGKLLHRRDTEHAEIFEKKLFSNLTTKRKYAYARTELPLPSECARELLRSSLTEYTPSPACGRGKGEGPLGRIGLKFSKEGERHEE